MEESGGRLPSFRRTSKLAVSFAPLTADSIVCMGGWWWYVCKGIALVTQHIHIKNVHTRVDVPQVVGGNNNMKVVVQVINNNSLTNRNKYKCVYHTWRTWRKTTTDPSNEDREEGGERVSVPAHIMAGSKGGLTKLTEGVGGLSAVARLLSRLLWLLWGSECCVVWGASRPPPHLGALSEARLK
jgi:hypothetical protein